jgi:hypothetical protein
MPKRQEVITFRKHTAPVLRLYHRDLPRNLHSRVCGRSWEKPIRRLAHQCSGDGKSRFRDRSEIISALMDCLLRGCSYIKQDYDLPLGTQLPCHRPESSAYESCERSTQAKQSSRRAHLPLLHQIQQQLGFFVSIIVERYTMRPYRSQNQDQIPVQLASQSAETRTCSRHHPYPLSARVC